MRRILLIIVLLLISCTKKETIISTNNPPSNTGVTKSFDVGSDNDCSNSFLANSSNADKYCISLGYEYSTSYEKKEFNCHNGSYKPGTWITKVTCYKR